MSHIVSCFTRFNAIEWQSYNYGPAELIFYDRRGKEFNGNMQSFLEIHGSLAGFMNIISLQLVLLNSYGEIAAKGRVILPETSDKEIQL